MLSLPGLHPQPLPACPSRQALGPGRPDRHLEPRDALLPASPAGARRRVHDRAGRPARRPGCGRPPPSQPPGSAGEGLSGTLRFRRPDGTVVADHLDPGPLRGPTVAERARRSGAEIDASTCQARSAGARCDHGIAINGLLERVEAARARRETHAGIPAVSSPASAASSGPSDRRAVSGGDSAEMAANVPASAGGAARPVWCSD